MIIFLVSGMNIRHAVLFEWGGHSAVQKRRGE
jgi:hypothetical protein